MSGTHIVKYFDYFENCLLICYLLLHVHYRNNSEKYKVNKTSIPISWRLIILISIILRDPKHTPLPQHLSSFPVSPPHSTWVILTHFMFCLFVVCLINKNVVSIKAKCLRVYVFSVDVYTCWQTLFGLQYTVGTQ